MVCIFLNEVACLRPSTPFNFERNLSTYWDQFVPQSVGLAAFFKCISHCFYFGDVNGAIASGAFNVPSQYCPSFPPQFIPAAPQLVCGNGKTFTHVCDVMEYLKAATPTEKAGIDARFSACKTALYGILEAECQGLLSNRSTWDSSLDQDSRDQYGNYMSRVLYAYAYILRVYHSF